MRGSSIELDRLWIREREEGLLSVSPSGLVAGGEENRIYFYNSSVSGEETQKSLKTDR